MKKAFRISHIVCILLVLGLVVGCGDDDPVNVKKTTQDDPSLAGSIGIYADMDGTDSNLMDNGQIVNFYVVHKVSQGVTASSFKVETPAGWRLLGTQSQFQAAVGNINDGISIGYGQCLSGSIHVMTLTYQSPGNSEPGTMFKIQPHSQWPANIQVVDCSEAMLDDGTGEESPVFQP